MASPEEIAVAEQIIRSHVLRSYQNQGQVKEAWRTLPEIPDGSDFTTPHPADSDTPERWDDYQFQDRIYYAPLPHNPIDGPWPSKQEYITAHYEILREDAIAPLRKSVKTFKNHPNMNDDENTHVYTHVHFKGILLSRLGPAFRIEFSTDRADKQVRWEQSPRLQQGTMVALSPMDDGFRSICKTAIVAARPYLGGLDQNPPQVDLFWGNIDEAVLDLAEPYVMIEAKNGYFEASRHMLVALQKLRTEQFGLSKQLVDLDANFTPPDWLKERRFLDLTSLIRSESSHTFEEPTFSSLEAEEGLFNADVLGGFPKIPASGMDDSQLAACECMITRKVSIVQGPPGTGKTFTSVSALKVLVKNLDNNSPPIVIAAQTNHALDQLLKHILNFEPDVLRMGTRSDKENVAIQQRTLHTLRSSIRGVPNLFKGIKPVMKLLEKVQQEIQALVDPLVVGNIISEEVLLNAGLITAAQKDSLCESDGGDEWACGDQGKSAQHGSPLERWLGSGNLVPIPQTPVVNLGLPVEESDLEYEQLQQIEEQAADFLGEKEEGALSGILVAFKRRFTGRCDVYLDERGIRKMLSAGKSLYDIPSGERGRTYRYFERQLEKRLLVKLKDSFRAYEVAVDQIRIAKWVSDFRLIKHLGIKVIGCTTTGIAKYRGLLAALQPRTLLIEEAAETLEGNVMAGMFESLQQLILVGDHQQLRASCNVKALELEPFNLTVSMFERLIKNGMPFTMLNQQRRMIPEIRKLLCIEPKPFYPDLYDHFSVLDRKTIRPPVPGMGGRDIYFFNHNWADQVTSGQSFCNIEEARMIAEFFNYLLLNGVQCPEITVLTFYNGQRKEILKELKRHPGVGHNTYFNVFTVDSYQGEENDVILLSVVRSNLLQQVGFLKNKNRLVVALSRAKRGLYIFGNAVTLAAREQNKGPEDRNPLWTPLLRHLRDANQLDIDGGLPITCSTHGTMTRVYTPDDFVGLAAPECQKDNLRKPELLNARADKTIFASQDVRKYGMIGPADNMYRNISGPAFKRTISGGHARSKFGVLGGQRNLAPSATNFALDGQHNISFPNYSAPSTVEQWKNWDAKKADKEANEERQRIAAENIVDHSKLVYKDTFRGVKIENGVRVSDPTSSGTVVIPRFDFEPISSIRILDQAPRNLSLTAAVNLGETHKEAAEISPFSLPTGPHVRGPTSAGQRGPSTEWQVSASMGGPNDSDNMKSFCESASYVPAIIPTLTFEMAHLTATSSASLIDFGERAVAQDQQGSNFADLLGLELDMLQENLFGSAEDFDQFEKHFG